MFGTQIKLFHFSERIKDRTKRSRRAPTRRIPTEHPVPSHPALKQLWITIRQTYFPERADLDSYAVVWSRRRQRRTLASCNLSSHRVIVARELDYPQHACWLEPLLYHEMCHAVLGDRVGRKGQRNCWHGPRFQALESRHPKMNELDHWIRSGGWSHAVRSDRAKRMWQSRRATLSQ